MSLPKIFESSGFVKTGQIDSSPIRYQISQRISDYPVDTRIDKLIEHLVKNQDRVKPVARNRHFLGLHLDGTIYTFWVANHFAGYLSRGGCLSASATEIRHPDDLYLAMRSKLWDGAFPSVDAAVKFYEMFDLTTCHLVKEDPGPKSFIQPPR